MSKVQEKRGAIARYNGHIINWCTFEYHVLQVRLNLLRRHTDVVKRLAKVLNLCEDRYHFLVVFTASMLEARTTIMPANHSEGELARLTSANKDVQLINDSVVAAICRSDAVSLADNFSWKVDLVPDAMIVAELYTSGSTGTPVAHYKSWRQLLNGAQQVYTRFGLNRAIQTSIIATVPPQHMFGFEMSIVLPLVCGVYIHHDQPFYPLDIQSVVDEMPLPRILVTTPIHLKACITQQNGWHEIEKVISATSPLSVEVAHQVESLMNTKAEEIYGCSEIGAIATRRLSKNPDWELLPDYSLSIVNEQAQLQVPALAKPVTLPDKLEIISDRAFRLVGRATDMIKIGGKRGSLAELTSRLKALQGVEDAVVFIHEHKQSQRQRLAALVIAQGFTSEQLREALSKEIDPVFLPRPLCIVQALPYTSTGKLRRVDLLASLNNHRKKVKLC
jgi:acyl-coenzyme A synthetase/AMP-(fatty) acid ligase